jgi:tRNA U34 2-thiouridine synthase MnmA/TrmU
VTSDAQRESPRPRAVGLLSGGLDSILACRIMLEQGIEVFGLNYTSPFCTCTHKGCQHAATAAAQQLGIPLKLMATGQEYIEIVKHPRHGRGRNMNPCLDCRVFTFSRAREYADEIRAAFVFSGEVLGERPMSQHLQALKLIERESGLTGRLLRPVSARLLEPTRPELEGLVDREKLLAISGRSREPQIALAEQFSICDYPCPAGGCLLTDALFSVRLKDAFAHGEDTVHDMKLLRVGRHFRLESGVRVVVGRDESENSTLANLTRPEDTLLEPAEVPGPTVLLRNSSAEADVRFAAQLCARYSDGHAQAPVKVKTGNTTFDVPPASDQDLSRLRVGA